MADLPPTETKNTTEPPAPEELKAQSDKLSETPLADTITPAPKPATKLRHTTYRPSHKATFIGVAVVAVILIINAVVIMFVLNGSGDKAAKANQEEVTLSSAALDALGVSRNPVGSAGTQLIIGPDTHFNGKVTVGSDLNVSGQLKINGKFSAGEASFAKLEGGDTSLNKLSVNGDATATSLALRKDLSVVGLTRLQGPTTFSQLVTINNNLNVSGSMSVGGTLSVRSFQASSLVSDTTLTIGGHIITAGAAPGFSAGSALGSNGTASNSGNDAAGTVAANIGVGATPGIIGTVTFRNKYTNTPHVVVTVVGQGAGSIYVNRSATGFSIGVNSALPPGGFAFDYIVMQ